MKRFSRIVSALVLLCLVLVCFTACGEANPGQENPPAVETPSQQVTPSDQVTPEQPSPEPSESTPLEVVDYVSRLKLDMSSETLKQEVTVKTYVDGDTVHFIVPEDVMDGGVLKARFLAVNTPESTGKIEEYGKKAARFTREKLSSATSIIIESDDENWNADSTGGRYLVWVWYRTDEAEEYRNLNLEILQNGLAIASSSANNRYGDIMVAAIAQAKEQKLNVYSGQKDPDFYYGDAIELTLKELRTNTEAYNGMKVAFNGVITMNSSNSVFIEDFDPETGRYYGISAYYGYNLSGAGLEILTVGNMVRIVGTVQYYEAGGTWQVSDLNYRLMKPDDPGNIQKISSGHSGAFLLTDADTFVNGKVELELEEGVSVFDYAQLALSTTLEMKNLKVVDAYTTMNEDSSSYGAMTLTCQVDGITVLVRTAVLYDENNERITQDAYLGRTIDVKGIVDYFDGTYQIKVFTAKDIIITN